MIVADPGLIGSYGEGAAAAVGQCRSLLQGHGTPSPSRPGRGIATPSGTSGEITVLTSANDFADDLVVDQARARRAGAPDRRRGRPPAADRLGHFGRPHQGAARGGSRLSRARSSSRRSRRSWTAACRACSSPSMAGSSRSPSSPTAASPARCCCRSDRQADAQAGAWSIVTYATPESNRKATDQEIAFLERFKELGLVERQLQHRSSSLSGDSREPELAGIRGALVGSAADADRHAAAVPADRRHGGDLSRGVRARRTGSPT